MSITSKSATRAIAWVATLATALSFALPVAAFQSRANTVTAKWVSQTPGAAAGGATVVNANGGDVLNFSLTVQNTSKTDILYPTSALLAEPAPYEGGHRIRVGATGDVVYDNIFDFSYGGPYVNNNRFAEFASGNNVAPGQNLTFNWSLKVKAGIPNGTYRYKVGVLSEWDRWFGSGTPNDNLGGRLGGTIFWDIVVGGGSTTPAAGGLSVSLASGTPAAGNIATSATTAASADFTKITLAPAAGASVSVNSIYVTRMGLSVDSQFQNVQLVRASDGVQMGSTAGGFDANHKAQIFFSPAMVLTTPTDFFIRAGVTTNATAGNTVGFGIASNSDIVSNATSITGAPVSGNLFTVVTLTIGSLTVAQYGSVADSTPDVGDTDVVTNTFQLTAGSTEDVTVSQITVLKAGTAATTDTGNIELWNDTTNASVATVTSWNADGKAVFNFPTPLVIAKGNNVRFTVRLDILSGSGLTVNTDLVDGSAALIVVKGNLYGYFITPTISGGWGGQGAASQTINAGALVISKSASTVPTGNVTVADNQNLGTWDFDARGEPINLSALHINLTIGQVAGTPVGTDVTNARLFDESGNIVLGPVDGNTTDTGAGDRELDFTSTFQVPVGVHKYTLKARLGTNFLGTDTILAAITAAGDVTARTVRTNTSVVPTGVPATQNTQTVKGVALSSTTLNSPAARNITPGISGYVWMTGSFNASNSGEDVRVTAAQFQLTVGATADADELINYSIWADLTSANSSRGDKYETKISNTEQPSGANVAGADPDVSVTLTTPLTVKKDSFVEIAFVGDLSAAASADGGGDTIEVGFDQDASDITASGVDTGTAVTTAPTSTNTGTAAPGQLMTIVSGGAVTMAVDSSSPQADILIGGATSKTVAVYRATSNPTEAVKLKRLKLTNDSTGDENTGTWYLYSNRDGNGNLVTPFLAASVPNGATLTFNFADNVVTIPADSVAMFTIKTDILAVDGTTVQNNDTVDTDIADLTSVDATANTFDTDVDFVGIGSGRQLPATGTDGISNANHKLFKSRPYISFAADTPSGALTPTSAGSVTGLIAKVNVTADAAFDIAFTSNGGGNDSRLTFKVNSVTNDDGVASAGSKLVDLSTSTTLYATADDIEAAADIVADFDTGGADLFVAAGTTKTLGLYADTQAYEDSGDSLQIWMDDGTADSVDFGTTITADSTANAYDVSAIVLRGDKFGGTLVKA